MQPITEEIIPEIKNRIVKGVHPEKIILFGSYAWKPDERQRSGFISNSSYRRPMHKRIMRIRKLIRDIRVPKDILV